MRRDGMPWGAVAVTYAVVGTAALELLAACTPLPPGDVLPDAGGGEADAAAELPPSKPPTASVAECEHARPPPRPAAEPAASRGPDLELVLATRYYEVGDRHNDTGEAVYPSLGYDLDGHCTGQGQGHGCRDPGLEVPEQDGVAGRDHIVNELLYLFKETLPAAQRQWLQLDFAQADTGKDALLIRVQDYNGLANDGRVRLEIFGGTLWDGPTPDDPPQPRWDGDDTWQVGSPWLEPSTASADGTLRARYVAEDAYVTNYRVVAHFDRLLLGSVFAPFVELHQAILAGRLTEDASGIALRDGILAGRWPIASFLQRLCDEPGYPDLEDQLCRWVDVSTQGETRSAPCDALSFALGLTAFEAQIGAPLTVADLPSTSCEVRCEPAQARP